jgi:hypothetical protein
LRNRRSIFPKCLGCAPGARTFCAKSIGRAGPLPGGFDRLPQNAAGRSGKPPDAPTRREPLHRRFKRLARLVHEMKAASWFLRRRSLPPGLPNHRWLSFGVSSICVRFERFRAFEAMILREFMTVEVFPRPWDNSKKFIKKGLEDPCPRFCSSREPI